MPRFEFVTDAVRDAIQGVQAADDDPLREYFATPAPNVVEWVASKEFLDFDAIWDHHGQFWMLRDAFELLCPLCAKPRDRGIEGVRGRSRETLSAQPLLVWDARLDDDVCPQCRTTRSELRLDNLVHDFNKYVLICGKRAGKSVLAALFATYLEHIYLTYAHRDDDGKGFFRACGIPPGDLLDMALMASTKMTSSETVWAKFKGRRALSPWYQKYIPWVKAHEKRQRTPKGMRPWTYQENDQSIVNEFAGLICSSLSSNSAGHVGRTRFGAFVDEICYLEQSDSKLSAAEVWAALDDSLQTVKSAIDRRNLPRKWMGFIAAFSSPKHIDDYGMRLLDAARRTAKLESEGAVDDNGIPIRLRTFAAQVRTTAFTPYVTDKHLAEAYATDPIMAERNFGAQPPMAAFPLVTDPERFRDNAVDHELEPTSTFTFYEFVDPTGKSLASIRMDDAPLILDGYPRFLVFDAGLTFDAFAGACAHGVPQLDQDGTPYMETVFDWIFRIVPREKQEARFEAAYEIVKALQNRVAIGAVEFDHWNSANLIQQIRALGVRAEMTATKDVDYARLVTDGYTGKVRLLPELPDDPRKDPPFRSGAAVALYELVRLERDPKTGRVHNPRKGERRGWDSNDTAQVCAHVHRLVQELGYTAKHDDRSLDAARRRMEAEGAAWLSQGGGQIMQSNVWGGGGRQGVSVSNSMRRGGRGW